MYRHGSCRCDPCRAANARQQAAFRRGERFVENSPDPYDLPRLRSDFPTGWMQDANCKGLNPSMFFPTRGEACDEIRAVCAACAVREECLDYCLSLGSRVEGFWGGMSERERRQVRRKKSKVVGVTKRACLVCKVEFTSRAGSKMCSEECATERRRVQRRKSA